ncbi:hypothetical protein ACFVVU_22495 [Kitasatospora sp. NPDC057965]|uniref:hypothetical protein n=1 Tax=Kitasatospora sp. NPDC057965 TaxID=3346291 RepID=UPI0036DAE9CA
MAVKKLWTIAHACGHENEGDLGDRPADRRAGFADWLSRQDCTDCWRASRDGDEADKAAWLAAKRAVERTESEAWSTQYQMPPLEGTERGVAWGVRCRHQVLVAAYTALVLEGGMPEADWEQVEDQARTITRAGWWINQRSSEPANLEELLEAAADSDRPTENPFV